MKFTIYGAGKRGQDMLKILGRENVVSFVDRNNEKVGTEYCGLPIIGIDEMIGISKSNLCVVTPVSGRNNIIENLLSKGITNCISAKPFDRVLFYEKESILGFIYNKYARNNIGIYGVSVGSIVLYEYLAERMHKEVFLIPNPTEDKTYDLNNWNYITENLESVIRKVDIIISTEVNLNLNTEKVIADADIRLIKMQELLENNISFYNRKIEDFKNIHEGQRCFIVATGPSLLPTDLETLYVNNEKCISMNRIYNIFGQTSWRPDYYMIEDALMIEDLSKEIAGLAIPVKFVSSIPSSYWEQDGLHDSIKYQLLNLDHQGNDLPFFSSDIQKCIYGGSTVTYACIQLAAYMGFKEIYLLGVDFNYSDDLYDENNHFSGYQSDGKVRLNAVYPERMKAAYERAKHYANTHGIKIYNATRGGKLEVFERIEFDKLF